MVKLRPMRDKEYAFFIKYSAEDYARQQILNKKWSDSEAKDWLAQEGYSFLSQGQNTPGHTFLRILNIQDIPVGYLWLTEKESSHDKTIYINDILIEKAHRRKGYANFTLNTLEEWCREKNIQTIALHVFPNNAEAQKLYNRAGFSPKNDMSEIWVKHLL